MMTATDDRVRRARLATSRTNRDVLPRVQRQHRIVEELRARSSPTPARALAVSLGVGLRTIERDVAQLVDAGLPVVATRGRYGGYRLDVPARLAPVELSVAEASAIAVALSAVGPYSSACNQSALEKVLGVLTPRRVNA